MTTISIDIGYDSAEAFRAKSTIVGKKKNDEIIYYRILRKTGSGSKHSGLLMDTRIY